jgi:Transposase, Mutator family
MAETKRMMTDEVVGYLLEGEGLDFLRESLCWVVQQLMEAEVSELVGAERGERPTERLTHRNGYRSRPWATRAGEIELAIPKLRRGSYFPSFLEPRRRSEQALVPVGAGGVRVHFLHEALGQARREQQPMLAALLRPIFNPTRARAHASSSATRSSGCASRCQGSPSCSRRLRKTCSPLRLPGRPLAEAAFDQPARAGQPQDRKTHRRRRHLPRRPLADPARRQHRDRTKRRVARWQALPQQPLTRSAARSGQPRQRQRRGPRAHRGLSSPRSRRRVTPRPGT